MELEIKNTNHLSNMHEVLLRKVLVYLSFQEQIQLRLLNRHFLQIISEDYSIYADYTYRNFLNDQVRFTLDIQYLDCAEYIDYRDNKIMQKLQSSEKKQWKTLSRDLTLKKTQDKDLKFIEFYIEQQFPKPTLKRETIGIHAATDHQTMLSTRLEQEQKGQDFMLFQNYNELMQNIHQNKLNLINEAVAMNQNAKEHFFNLRWYLDEYQTEQEPQEMSTIIKLQHNFIQVTQDYCKAIFALLAEFIENRNACDILSEYTIYWQNFGSAIQEISLQLIPLEQAINSVWQETFPNYPQYPKFSNWRTLIKIWIKFVYDPFKEVFQECFLKLIKFRRNQNLQIQFGDKQAQEDEFFVPRLSHLTHSLYDNFIKVEQFLNNFKLKQYSVFDPKNMQEFDIKTDHPIFQNQTQVIDIILNKYFQSIYDISINEVSVHWLGHNEIQFDQPIQELLQQILSNSSDFYEQQIDIFENNFSQYIEFLDTDLKYINSITNQSFIDLLYKMQKEHIATHLLNKTTEKITKPILDQEQSSVLRIVQNSQLSTEYGSNQTYRSSLTSHSQTQVQQEENEELVDEEPVQQLFNFVLANPNVDLTELMLQEQIKKNPDPIDDIIRLSVNLNQDTIDHILMKQDCESFQQQQFNILSGSLLCSKSTECTISYFPLQPASMKSYSQISQQFEKQDVPEELIKFIKFKISKNNELKQTFDRYSSYLMDYQRNFLETIQRHQQIEVLNEEREIPKQLDNQTDKFYSINKKLTKQDIENAKIENQQQNMEDEHDEDDSDIYEISRQSSKLKKMDEYNSDDEDLV